MNDITNIVEYTSDISANQYISECSIYPTSAKKCKNLYYYMKFS